MTSITTPSENCRSTTLQNSIARRLDYRGRIGNDRYKQALEKAVCANDIVHWVNHWVWTYDPRDKVLKSQPFDLFPRQEEFLEWVEERSRLEEDGLADKSRDVGFTWLLVARAVHKLLHEEGYCAGFGSRKLDLVDKIGDPKCIFEKIRFALRNLPTWMLPSGFKFGRDDAYTKIVNPENGATITGEGGDEIGRGGRCSEYFVDESAYLEHPDKVDASLSQNTRVRIDVSTPNGPGNSFAKRRHSGAVSVFTLHWKSDPRHNHFGVWLDGELVATGNGTPETVPQGATIIWPYYEKEKKRLNNPVLVAQELDIDYNASVEGVCIPGQWVRAAVDLPLSVSDTYPLVAGFDVAEGGSNKSVFLPRRGPVVLEAKSWGQVNTTESAWRAADYAESLGVELVNFDAIGVGSGVNGPWMTSERKLLFTPNPVKWGDPPTDNIWPSGKTSKETFVNLRAELWWIVRSRFEKTFEYVTQGILHPHDELISIPNDPQLIAELSLPLYHSTSAGKIQIESKDDMKKRGVASPDFGDALAYSYAPGPVTWESW